LLWLILWIIRIYIL